MSTHARRSVNSRAHLIVTGDRDPFPGVEFRMLGGEIDVGIRAGESHRESFLALPAIPPAHYPLGDLVRHIVVKPATALGEDLSLLGADLLSQFAHCRLARGFTRINTAHGRRGVSQPLPRP